MAKLGFISDESTRIELEEGTWVEIRENIPFEIMASIQGKVKKAQDGGDTEAVVAATVEFLAQSITAWSDEREVSAENIRKLNYEAVDALAKIIVEHYTPEKKKLAVIEAMMLKGISRPGAEAELLDFQLSELFGLDWRQYDYKRISYIIAFVNARNERQNAEIRKSNRKK